jgi:hypothetical protein
MLQKNLKKDERTFCHRGDILLLVWKDKRDMHMISTIHDASMILTGKKYRKIGDEIKKPFCIVQYNNYMKGGVEEADQYLSYYSILRKTVKWNKKVGLDLINCGLFNSYRIYTALNPQKKNRYKQILLDVARDWTSDPLKVYECEEEPGPSAETKRVSKKDPPGSCPEKSNNISWKK